MRIFTTKDIEGIASAFQGFMKVMDGKTKKVTSLMPAVEKAISEGITLDELFNKGNYARAGAVIPSPDAEQYVDIMVNRQICPKEIRQESDWHDEDNMKLLANCFHDFFITINKKGGVFSTPAALLNLNHAVMVFGLQSILSEELINKASAEEPCTCYQYIEQILHSIVKPDTELSQEQAQRRNTKIIEEIVAESEDDYGQEHPEGEEIKVETAPDSQDNDRDLTEPTEEEDDFDPFMYDENEDDTHVGIINPAEMKRARIAEVIMFQSPERISELAKAILIPETEKDDEPLTLECIVDAISKGLIDPGKESAEARKAHEEMNYDLAESYCACARMLGFEMDTENSFQHDFIMEDWDLRDDKTRKFYKVKEAVYKYINEQGYDIDLHNALEDLEKLYAEE